jgi:hypothetical protein
VWLIFGPMSLSVFALPLHLIGGSTGPLESTLSSLLVTLFGALAVAILWSQTKRFLASRVDQAVRS